MKDAKVIAIARKYEDFANEYKRVFRIFYINCGTQMQLCDKLKPTKYPAIRIYPPLPIPAFDLEMVFSSYISIGRHPRSQDSP